MMLIEVRAWHAVGTTSEYEHRGGAEYFDLWVQSPGVCSDLLYVAQATGATGLQCCK